MAPSNPLEQIQMGKRPSSLLSILLTTALPFLGGGCATFVKFSAEGTGAANTFVRVNSVPQGVTGTVDSGRTFVTPANLVLTSDEMHTLTFAVKGSEPVVIHLQPSTHSWIWGNILTLGIGCIFDNEKGSDITLTPEEVLVTFEKEVEAPSSEPETTTDEADASS